VSPGGIARYDVGTSESNRERASTGIRRPATLEAACRIVELNSSVEPKRQENTAFLIHRNILNIAKGEFDRRNWEAATSSGEQEPTQEAHRSYSNQDFAQPAKQIGFGQRQFSNAPSNASGSPAAPRVRSGRDESRPDLSASY
jgi:hypothetical protein